MRIEGANEFLSGVAAWGDRTSPKHPLNPYVLRAERDSLDLSEIGKRLSLEAREEVKIAKPEAKAKTNGDIMLNLMDKSLRDMESSVEQMRELALAAANPNVTMAERLQMQIDMEKLREQLSGEYGSMSKKLAKMSGYEEDTPQNWDVTPGRPVGDDPSAFDTRSLLERARDRAVKGEAWDVAEAYEESWELQKVIVAGENQREFTIEDGEWFDLPPDINPEENVMLLEPEITGGRYVVTDDPKVPTVSEILKESGTVILTDVKSALEGVQRLDGELAELKDMRKAFAEFCETPEASEEVDVPFVEGDLLRTELGYMEKTDKGMRLTYPKGHKGNMFAKIQSLFDEMGERLTSGKVTDPPPNPKADKIIWTNRAQSWFSEESENSTQVYSADARIGKEVLETAGVIVSPGK